MTQELPLGRPSSRGMGEQELVLALGGWEKGQMEEARSGSQQAGSRGLWANATLSFTQRR